MLLFEAECSLYRSDIPIPDLQELAVLLLKIACSSSLIDDAFTFALVTQYTESGSTQSTRIFLILETPRVELDHLAHQFRN